MADADCSCFLSLELNWLTDSLAAFAKAFSDVNGLDDRTPSIAFVPKRRYQSCSSSEDAVHLSLFLVIEDCLIYN